MRGSAVPIRFGPLAANCLIGRYLLRNCEKSQLVCWARLKHGYGLHGSTGDSFYPESNEKRLSRIVVAHRRFIVLASSNSVFGALQWMILPSED